MREMNQLLSDAVLSLAEGLWAIAEARAGFRPTTARDLEKAGRLLHVLYRFAERASGGRGNGGFGRFPPVVPGAVRNERAIAD